MTGLPWDHIGLPRTAPHNGTLTSEEAARKIEGIAGTLRHQCYQAILDRGHGGATRDEVEVETGLKHQTATARVRELVQMGVVVETGMKRDTRSGRSAVVCVAYPYRDPLAVSVSVSF